MLIRYVTLYGCPRTEEEWKKYTEWKARQLAAPECSMTKTEVSPASADKKCAGCAGGAGCTKKEPPCT